MRRTLALLLVLMGALAALVLAVEQRPASAQDTTLSIIERGVHVYEPFEDGDQNAVPVPVMVLEPGEEYRFQVDYEVAGADQIVTGHVFNFEESVTDDRVRDAAKTFPPDAPGRYNESVTFVIPAEWNPGVYRFRYRVSGEATGLEPVAITGEASFLVSPRGSSGG